MPPPNPTPLSFTLKAAWKNPPRRWPHAKDTNLLDARIGGLLWLGVDLPREDENAREIANRYSVFQFVADYRRGVLPEKGIAIMSYETAKLGSGRVPAMTTRHVREKYLDDRNQVQTRIVEVCMCPTCGAVVVEEHDEEDGSPVGGKTITPAQAVEWVSLRRRFCQAPRPHRMPAALVAKRLKKTFGVLGVDELHKGKAKGMGVGWALTPAHVNISRSLRCRAFRRASRASR